jgi:hypothetical protein
VYRNNNNKMLYVLRVQYNILLLLLRYVVSTAWEKDSERGYRAREGRPVKLPDVTDPWNYTNTTRRVATCRVALRRTATRRYAPLRAATRRDAPLRGLDLYYTRGKGTVPIQKIQNYFSK